MANLNESNAEDQENVLVGNENEEGAGDADDATYINSSRKSEKLYQTHQLYLRSLLPEEIWRDILAMLKDPDDLLNCVNCSPYFWELEREERVVYLFPKVMEVLAVRYEPREFEVKREVEVVKNEESGVVEVKASNDIDLDREKGENLEPADANEEIDEEWIDDTDTEDDEEDEDTQRKESENEEWRQTLLNCRLVCSTWNHALENIYATPLMTGIREYVKNLDPMSLENTMYIERARWNVRIWDLQSAERFLTQFEQSHHSGATAPPKNPVFGRYVSINVNEHWQGPENFHEYQNTLTKILTMFGRHISYCTFTIAVSTNIEENYLKLREWLGLMPNLRFIRMIGPYLNAPMPIFQRSPLPVMEKLDNVILWRIAGPIVTEFLRRNGGHLKFLKMREINGVDVDSVGSLLCNLRSFSSEYCPSGTAILEKFSRGWKQITKLDLFRNEGFKTTFDFLQSADFPSDNLTDLRLQYGHSTLEEDSKALRLDLPNLRRLHLWIDWSFSLDFALPLAKSLEHLEISRIFAREVQKETVQFAGFEKKMHESNIWSLFRALKTIKMGSGYNGKGFTVYTREGNKFVYE